MGNTDQCPDLLRTEKQYFFRDQSVQCYNDEHYLYLYAIFLPALLFYVIMVPVFFFFQLKKHKRFIFAGPTLHRVTWGKYLSFCLLFLRPYFSLSITDNWTTFLTNSLFRLHYIWVRDRRLFLGISYFGTKIISSLCYSSCKTFGSYNDRIVLSCCTRSFFSTT